MASFLGDVRPCVKIFTFPVFENKETKILNLCPVVSTLSMLYVSIGSNINLYLFLLHIKCKTGKEKLGFSEAEVCVFTEDDGTEVEEDLFSEFHHQPSL